MIILMMQATTPGTTSGVSEWAIIIILVAIIAMGILMRRRRGAGTNLEAAIMVIEEVRRNLRSLVEMGLIPIPVEVGEKERRKLESIRTATTQPPLKKLKTGSWWRNKDKMTFLTEETRKQLDSAFTLALDFNKAVDEAKRTNSSASTAGAQAGTMGEGFTKGHEGLRVWIKDNYQTEMFKRRRGLFW